MFSNLCVKFSFHEGTIEQVTSEPASQESAVQ
jgi:hypothetical protein